MADRLTTMRRIRFLSIGLVLALLAFASSGHAFAETDAERQARIDDYVRTAEIDPTRPGADDPRVHEGMAALKARDFERAVAIWHPLAEAGNAEAQFRMGLMQLYGIGIEADPLLVEFWLKKALDQGHAEGGLNLGYLYSYSDKESQVYSLKLARIAYQHSATLGSARAQALVGLMYFSALGGEQDKVEGLKWLLIAFENGDDANHALDRLSEEYSKAQLALAKRKSKEWLKSHSHE